MQVDAENFADDVPHEEAFFYFTMNDFEKCVALQGAEKVVNTLHKPTAAALLDALSRRFYRV